MRKVSLCIIVRAVFGVVEYGGSARRIIKAFHASRVRHLRELARIRVNFNDEIESEFADLNFGVERFISRSSAKSLLYATCFRGHCNSVVVQILSCQIQCMASTGGAAPRKEKRALGARICSGSGAARPGRASPARVRRECTALNYKENSCDHTRVCSTSVDRRKGNTSKKAQLRNNEDNDKNADERTMHASCNKCSEVLKLEILFEQVVALSVRTERLEANRSTVPPVSSSQVADRDSSIENDTLDEPEISEITGTSRPQQHVKFEDTFKCDNVSCGRHGAGNPGRRPPTPEPAQLTEQAHNNPIRTSEVWGRGDASRSHHFHRTNLPFSGAADKIIDHFRRKMEDMQEAAHLTKSKLLTTLSMVFTGVADLWYGCYIMTWIDLQERMSRNAPALPAAG